MKQPVWISTRGQGTTLHECTECGALSRTDADCLVCTAIAALSEDVRMLNAMHLSAKARPFADAVTHDATKVLR